MNHRKKNAMSKKSSIAWAVAAACALMSAEAHAASDAQSLDEVRNTVINLLDSLVAKGVLTREQAEAMVKQAQVKAERETTAQVAQEAPVAGEVRVTYVPQIVKDEIREQVRAEVTPQVVKEVVAQAQTEKWGVPGALPEWVGNLKFNADIRVREEADLFASDNAQFAYLDFMTINDKGGIGKAGAAAFLNTSEDRMRSRLRVRAGVESPLGDNFSAGIRLATGDTRDPVSTNQTMAQMGGRYTFGVEQAWIRYDALGGSRVPWLTVTGGRMANPFLSTDLVYDTDLTFEGFSGTYRLGFNDGQSSDHHAYVTLGAFPLEEVALSSSDKWLYAAQLGLNWKFANDSRLRGSVAYYDYANIVGRRNPLDSTRYDYTAPKWLQKGNTLFDIRNDNDPSTNLFALAADYKLLDVVLAYDLPLSDRYQLSVLADYVNNVGYDARAVQQRTGYAVPGRTSGYQLEFGFGDPVINRLHAWRASFRYRYLQRDAVLDAFTDSDFHLGGTDSQGYSLRGDYGIGKNVSLSLRYLTANEIDGPPLGIDVVFLDLSAQF
jgi:polyhydroxyalkanoate synthesis regulator phasin